MLFRTLFTFAVFVGKAIPVFVVEKTCYRRIISGKRLHERFIRHSLPCNSLEACQHQCSIEKHFQCQGFNIRLDPAGVGRGVCELSSIATSSLDLSRDFVLDPEFVYYERDQKNDIPNCGHFSQIPKVPHIDNTIGHHTPSPISGGPYYGGDSYGPWSTGHGTVDHGPWGSHGYGSGFYESNNPSRGPVPSFRPNIPYYQDPNAYVGGRPYPEYRPSGSNRPGGPSYPVNSIGSSYPGTPFGSHYPAHPGGPSFQGGPGIFPYSPGSGASSYPANPGGSNYPDAQRGTSFPAGPGGYGYTIPPGRPNHPVSPVSTGYPENIGGTRYPGNYGGSGYPVVPGGSNLPAGSDGSRYPITPGGSSYPAGSTYPIVPGGPGGSSYPENTLGSRYPGNSGSQGFPVVFGGSNYPPGPNTWSYTNRPGGSNDLASPGGLSHPGPGSSNYPGGSGGPSYPVGPGASNYPAGSGGPGYPVGPGASNYPAGSGGPSYPVGPGVSNYPGGSGGPSYPVGSGGPNYPVGPGVSNYPAGSGGPSYPVGPGVSNYPAGSGGSSYPVRPGGNNYPGGSNEPNYPIAPKGPINPERPSGSGYPGAPIGPNYPAGPGSSRRPTPPWSSTDFSSKYPYGDRRYDRPNRIPTYVIIDADASSYRNPNRGYHPAGRNYLPPRPPLAPSRPQPLPRPLPPAPLPAPPFSSGNKPFGGGYYPPQPSSDKSFGVSHNLIGHEVCFRREHQGYKLNPSAIKGTYETPTVLECEAMCSRSPFKCTGYSYRYSSPGSGGANCLLTDYSSLNRETHLLPDRSCDVYLKMSTCADNDRISDTECFLKVAADRKIDPSKVIQKATVGGMSDCELACLTAKHFTCRSFSFRFGPGVIGEPIENCFLSDWPMSALTHLDFVPATNHEVYERGSYGHGCELDVGPPHIGPRPLFNPYPNLPQIYQAKDTWGVGDTWRHYTVSGWPCRVGTECQLNQDAGFWTCEVEGGDRAQWDYCCRPKHSCGFSRGYNYPWCYVGEAGPDQWRPCSEHYYPNFGNRFQNKPVQSHNPHPVYSYGSLRDTRPWNFGEEELGPPSYWPISYLYSQPPPNETYFWDAEEFDVLIHHFHHQSNNEQHPEHFHEFEDNSPKIKFKQCGNKFPYPRAIIQKLDLKNVPKAGNPGDQLRLDEKPRNPKTLSQPDSEIVLGFSLATKDKENLKNEVEFYPSATTPAANFTEDFSSSKRDLHKKNATVTPSTKAKKVIQEVDELIENNSQVTTTEPTEKNESLTKVESKYPGFVTLTQLEKSYFPIRFWN